MLIATDVTLTYPDGPRTLHVLESVDLSVPAGLTALVGPSGAGKSSLMRILAGLQRADSGRVCVNDHCMDSATRESGNPQIIYIPQDFQLVPFLSAAENVALAADVRGRPDTDVEDALDSVGLAGLGERKPSELSGGQQQRLALARALAVQAPVLLPDEPTGSLDADTSAEIAELLSQVATRERVVFVATHDPTVVEAARSVFSVRAGRVEQVR